MAHLACLRRCAELVEILERYAAAGVENVLALRGDPPATCRRFSSQAISPTPSTSSSS